MRKALFGFFSLLLLSLTTPTQAKVLWVPLSGTVELGLSPYIKRALEYAKEKKFDTVVLEIDTFGGRVDAAVVIRDALLDSPVNTVAWINKRAISAGALISLACKKIYFTPGSTMGAATPIQIEGGEAKPVENKMVSYFRAEMGATAEKNGRDRKIGESMVMAKEEIKGLVKKDDVLTLTDKTALTTKISDGTLATRDEVLKKLGVAETEVENFGINWAEKTVRFLTEPTVSSLLMSGGILGLVIEFQAPGFGLPGIFGVTCLALYFFGKFIVNLAGWGEVLLVLLGLALIFVELFLVPGKFLPGVLGATLVFIALFLAGISSDVPFDFQMPDVRRQLQSVSIAFLISFAGFLLAMYFMAKNPHRSPLVMADALDKSAGYSSSQSYDHFRSKAGVVVSDLRPTGKAEIEGELVEVIAQEGFIAKGTRVNVVQVDGFRIVVSKEKNIT